MHRPNTPRVAKFGGSSLRSATRLLNAVRIVEEQSFDIVIVSAIGKTTQKLAHIYALLENKDYIKAQSEFTNLCTTHRALLNEVSQNPQIEAPYKSFEDKARTLFESLQNKLLLPSQRAAFLSLGEYFSSLIFHSAWKGSHWVDIAPLIITSSDPLSLNTPLRQQSDLALKRHIYPLLQEGKKLVGQGFIATTQDGHATTLGFEGSDYTASLVSSALEAQDLTIWTDVAGVFNADPALTSKAKVINHLTYQEALLISKWGGKVLHPRTTSPLQDKLIPLTVKSSLRPLSPGTLIHNADMPAPPAFAVINNITYVAREKRNKPLQDGDFEVVNILTKGSGVISFPDREGGLMTSDTSCPTKLGLATCVNTPLACITKFLSQLEETPIALIDHNDQTYGIVLLDKDIKNVLEKLIDFLATYRTTQVA